MKHTLIFIEKIIVLLKYFPTDVTNEQNKNNARKYLYCLNEYIQILQTLLDRHKTEPHLSILLETHRSEIRDWAHQVSTVLETVNTLLITLQKDVEKLTHFLNHDPSKFQMQISDAAFGVVLSGLLDDTEDIIRLRNIAVFQIEHLNEIIKEEKHQQGLHFWQSLSKDEDERTLQQEKYFVRLLS